MIYKWKHKIIMLFLYMQQILQLSSTFKGQYGASNFNLAFYVRLWPGLVILFT